MPDPEFEVGLSYETGGHEESDGGTAPAVQDRATGPGSPRPEEEYTAKFDWKDNSNTHTFTPGTTKWITIHTYIRFENVHPQVVVRFWSATGDPQPKDYLYMSYTTSSGVFELFDANGTSKGTSSGWKANTWYHVVVKFKKANSSDVLIVRHELLDDGTVVESDVVWDLAGVDCEPGGTLLRSSVVNNVDPAGPGGAAAPHAGSITIETDSGANIDSVNTWDYDITYLIYQNTTQGTNSDFPTDSTDRFYPWSRAGDLPRNDATYALYTLAQGETKTGGCWTNNGDRIGPNGDSRLPAAGTLHGAEFVWRVEAHPGDPIRFWGRYGNSGSTPATQASYTTVSDAAPVNVVQYINAGDAAMPTSSEYFAHGMEAYEPFTFGTGLRLMEQWALLVLRRLKVDVPVVSLGIIRGPGIVPVP